MAERVVFSRSLYRLDGIEAAAQAYAEIAKIEVTPNDHDIVVVFDCAHEGAFLDAFCNHALFETVRRHRQAIGGAL